MWSILIRPALSSVIINQAIAITVSRRRQTVEASPDGGGRLFKPAENTVSRAGRSPARGLIICIVTRKKN